MPLSLAQHHKPELLGSDMHPIPLAQGFQSGVPGQQSAAGVGAAEQQQQPAQGLPQQQARGRGAPAGGGLPLPPDAAARLQLHYHTSWQQPVLHHSINGGEWQGFEMQPVVSGSGWWKAADLHLDGSSSSSSRAGNGSGSSSGSGSNGGAAAEAAAAATAAGAPLLEFVVTDGQDSWDKPLEGGNYQIHSPGRWHLREGRLAAAAALPVLVVSDLDDTMIGDDEATAAFTAWWLAEGVAAGGRLVYNTGRALDLFQALLAEKGQLLAEPDRLISSLGTRIYAK